LFSLYKTQQRS